MFKIFDNINNEIKRHDVTTDELFRKWITFFPRFFFHSAGQFEGREIAREKLLFSIFDQSFLQKSFSLQDIHSKLFTADSFHGLHTSDGLKIAFIAGFRKSYCSETIKYIKTLTIVIRQSGLCCTDNCNPRENVFDPSIVDRG